MNQRRKHLARMLVLATTTCVLATACDASSSASAKPTSATGSESSTSASPTSGAAANGKRTTAAPIPGLLVVPGDRTMIKAAVPAVGTTVNASLKTPDGRVRTYHLYVPTTVRAGTHGPTVPLLIALHGGLGWGTQFEKNSGFDELAEANGFIVAYPDGSGADPSGTQRRTWNGGKCCGTAVRNNVDDVGFIRALIVQISSRYPINAKRVTAAGHSNGGILAYRLACELSDKIVAIGVQSTALELSPCRPTHTVSVLQIHGSADKNIPIGGGVGPNAVSGVSFNRPINGAKALAFADRCGVTPRRTADAANHDIVVSSWNGCADHTRVMFAEVAGATHAWMGHAKGGSPAGGPAYAKLDSSATIWNFLTQHPRR